MLVIVALAACGSSSSKIDAAPASIDAGSPDAPSALDCVCACDTLLSGGGCGDICDMAKNGTTTPNFCNGVAALSQCTNCLMANCGFDSTETANGTLCMP
jgi:hypothetical protein